MITVVFLIGTINGDIAGGATIALFWLALWLVVEILIAVV
jgi:hypothetical protein